MGATAIVGAGSGCLASPIRGDRYDAMISMAVTTSLDDTEIIASLNLEHQARTGTLIRTIPRGSGAALRLLRDGDVVLSMAHAPALEDEHLDAGHAVDRRPILWNRFTVVGPPADPAGIGQETTLTTAFEQIEAGGHLFLSRGDDSGTHQREMEVWEALGIDPAGDWYQTIGQGMGGTLVQAAHRNAYTLADTGTILVMSKLLNLEALVDTTTDDPLHRNRYSILAANPDRHPNLDHELAREYAEFLLSEAGQAIIDDFNIDGEHPFWPISTFPEGRD